MSKIIDWLLEGDVSIQYQTKRDLLDQDDENLQKQISERGFGRRFLQEKHNNGYLGRRIYSPKWTSLHYVLFDLLWIEIHPDNEIYKQNVLYLIDKMWYKGKDNKYLRQQDLCVSAMILHMAVYCNIQDGRLKEIVDYILTSQFPDGGWNCEHERGAHKSSLHTTLSVLEAFHIYHKNNYTYRLSEIQKQVKEAEDFILRKELYKSERTGELIKKAFLQFPFPCRWKYDYLRALDYFRRSKHSYDPRMKDALKKLKKAHKNGYFYRYSKYPGLLYFSMEDSPKGSRWNTLRALRVLRFYQKDDYSKLINSLDETTMNKQK